MGKPNEESRWGENQERDLRANIASENALRGNPELILAAAQTGTRNDVAGILAGERFRKDEEK